MAIPLPALMRKWRERDFDRGNPAFQQRLALKTWAFLAKRPRLYHALSGAVMPALARLAGGDGRFRHFPLAAAWTRARDLPAPEGETFHARYRKGRVRP
jgi:L-lactate dehydrogenase complex protein LldF